MPKKEKIIRYTCLCGKYRMGARSNRGSCGRCRERIEYIEDRIIISDILSMKIMSEIF